MYQGEFSLGDFRAPRSLETAQFRLRTLALRDAVTDYDAVMTSVSHLKGVFGPADDWPRPEMTLHEDMIDLGWHEKEFALARSFAYTVMSLDESRCLGCVYLFPERAVGFDAHVILWVRASEAGTGLDDTLYASVKSWVAEVWPFKAVLYPGREIDWQDYLALPRPSRPVSTS